MLLTCIIFYFKLFLFVTGTDLKYLLPYLKNSVLKSRNIFKKTITVLSIKLLFQYHICKFYLKLKSKMFILYNFAFLDSLPLNNSFVSSFETFS